MIIFLFGEDDFRSKQKLNQLKQKFINDVDPTASSLSMLDGKNISIKEFNETAGPSTLLASKRMIIVDNIFMAKEQNILEQIFEYLKEKKSDKSENIIIFYDTSIKIKKTRFKKQPLKIDASGKEKPLTKKQSQLFNFLSKQKWTQEFSVLSNTETANWAKKQIEAKNGKITYQAAQTLVSLTGNNLWQANNEINKLINYKLSDNKNNQILSIDVQDVKLLVKGNFDENIFALTDAISNKNISLATKLLEEQIEAGLAGSYLINMMVRQFRILLQIRQALDIGQSSRQMISALKLHPFIIQKGINQVRKFNLTTLKNILKQLIEIDFKMKTGQADAITMLNLLFVKL